MAVGFNAVLGLSVPSTASSSMTEWKDGLHQDEQEASTNIDVVGQELQDI